jgi:hypothetical protein
MAAAALLAALGASCTRQAVTIEPRYVFRGVPELRSTGTTALDVSPDGTHEFRTDDVLEVAFRKCEAFGLLCRDEPKKLTVAQLIENCPDVAPFREDSYRRDRPCALLDTSSKAITVDTRLRPDWDIYKVIGGALLVALVLGVVVGYVAECADPHDSC